MQTEERAAIQMSATPTTTEAALRRAPTLWARLSVAVILVSPSRQTASPVNVSRPNTGSLSLGWESH